MSPFQAFRYWLRRAPVSERVISGLAAAVALALLSWLLIPETERSERGSSAVAVALINIVGPAANSLFGIPPPAQQRADYDAAIAAANAEGGVACRELVPQYFEINAADSSDRQQKCLDIAAAGAYAMIDGGSYATFPEKVC